MVRGEMIKKEMGGNDRFRWRGTEVSRIEGFTDAVLAFAVTLLVVSLEVPKTFDQLLVAMQGFGPFAICFLLLIQVWYEHYRFFRRFGLQDFVTFLLNGALLFVILFFVYPLKFLFSFAFIVPTNVPEGVEVPIRPEQMPTLFVIYGLGFAAVFLILALMYLHALRQRRQLELNEVEVFETKAAMVDHLIMTAIGLLSVGMALIPVPSIQQYSYLAYFLTPIGKTILGTIVGRQRRIMAEHHPATT